MERYMTRFEAAPSRRLTVHLGFKSDFDLPAFPRADGASAGSHPRR
jgi:hypothetical protein